MSGTGVVGTDRVAGWLADGSLLHPIADVPSFVDLVRYLAMLSGAQQFPETDGISRLRTIIEPADCIVFVLVDGLGMNMRRHFPKGGFFESYFRQELRAVFPSTTACALTTLSTGAWPAEHGLTGWWTYFPEVGRTISPLRFRERFTDIPAQRLGLRLSGLIPVSSNYPHFMRETATFVPRHVAKGEYPQWSRGGVRSYGYVHFDQLRRHISRYVSRIRRPGFIYVYTLDVDSSLHKGGSGADTVREAVKRNDAMLAALRESLPETARIIVTADHGLVDVPRTNVTVLSDNLPVADHLEVPPSAEGTTPVFHVKPGHEDSFLRAFDEMGLGERYALLTPNDAEALRLYGPVDLAGTTRSHLGSFIGIAREPYVIEYVRGNDPPLLHLASHGGLRPDEMRTPLFVA